MQWSLFLFILMGSFLTCQQYEYHFIKEEKTWDEAQMYCREKYTDLATVYDMTDMMKICESTESQDEAWIGLQNMPGNFKCHWSLPGVECKEDETNWCFGQPRDIPVAHTNCVYIKWNLDYKKIYCFFSHCISDEKFICYDEKNSSKKFHVIDDRKSWPEAQSYCRQYYTDLVSGVNQLEDEELNEEIKNSDFRRFRIGLFRDTWRWSDESSSSFRHWDHNYFDNPSNKEKCAVTMLNNEGRWKTDNCLKKKSFFCYDDKVILIKKNKTWEEALYYCRENYHDLVSITNDDEQGLVEKKAKMADSPYIWLGLRYTCTLDFWFWVSDEVVSYKNWDSDGQIDECDMSGAMERGGEHKWIRHHDNATFNFICSKF